MSIINFKSFSGFITSIEDYPMASNHQQSGCQQIVTVQRETGQIVRFIVRPNTYFPSRKIIAPGDWITGYYDGDAPAILIYPPQYPALIIVKGSAREHVKVDFFDEHLISNDGLLQLTITPETPKYLTNGQPFRQPLTEKNLVVRYGPATKSIPALTIPYEIIVYCPQQ